MSQPDPSDEPIDQASVPLTELPAAAEQVSLREDRSRVSPPSQSDAPAIDAHWLDTSDSVRTMTASHSIAFRVSNTTQVPIEVDVALRYSGLGERKESPFRHLSLGANVSTDEVWNPGDSSVKASDGSSVSVELLVRYTYGGVSVASSVDRISAGWSHDMKAVHVSTNDTAVRLASLGLRADGQRKGTLAASERRALLRALGQQHGERGGQRLDRTAEQASAYAAQEAPATAPEAIAADTVSLDGDLNENAPAVVAAALAGPTFCAITQHVGTTTSQICAHWKPLYIDLDAYSATVPQEDEPLYGSSASYANASFYSRGTTGTTSWNGRLDKNGCTPVLEYCTTNASMSVSTASFKQPAGVVGSVYSYGSREFLVDPAKTFTTNLRFASTAGGGTLAYADVNADEPVLRVAAVLSRILRMPDNGVLGNTFSATAQPVYVHAEQGCNSYPQFLYAPGLYGEACAGGLNRNEAWFGPTLAYTGGQPYSYVATTRHTTQEAYTVGHELGHVQEYGAQAEPANGGYTDAPLTGNCSCDHVNIGNRLHCLQSRHNQGAAHIEGFAHFYATRVMNDQGPNARFTYYKTYRNITYYSNGTSSVAGIAPPYPVNAAQPFQGSPYANVKGWTRNFCAASNTSSEYDWLTFLWSLNGSATGSAKFSMSQLYQVNSDPVVRANYTWSNLTTKVNAAYGTSSAKAQNFALMGQLHSTNL